MPKRGVHCRLRDGRSRDDEIDVPESSVLLELRVSDSGFGLGSEAGIAGEGGEMTFGDGAVWATMIGYPITRISPDTNRVVGQWHGDGGDSIRVGYGSLWLTNLKGGKVWRLSFPSGANQ